MRWREATCITTLAGVAAAAVLLVSVGGGGAAPPRQDIGAEAWSGLVGSPRAPVTTGQRVLVVLSSFSLADRVARGVGLASDVDERRWTSAALAAQGQFIGNLARQGIAIRPEF